MYQASIESWGDTRSLATTRHSSFAMDTQGKGANPVDTLLVGLCACIGHYVRDFLVQQGLRAPRFRVSSQAAAARDENRLDAVSVRIELGELELGAERERELLAQVEQCIIHGTLRRACPVDVAIQRSATSASAA